MNYNSRIINIDNCTQASAELTKLNCDSQGIALMSNKAVFKVMKIEKVPAKAANLLKQTFLAKGGEVAVARGTADLSIDCTDVLICATLKQYNLALAQLRAQPWGLPKIAQVIEKTLQAQTTFPNRFYQWKNCSISISPGKTLVMGILNVTPDSFSDGGKFNTVDKALEHVNEMITAGADIIDIGAESTRPYGAEPIPAQQELERLMPILEKVLSVATVPVSVDTYKAEVAEEALKSGAHIINDVWGLQKDHQMAGVIAKYKVPVVIMHNQIGTAYTRDIMSSIGEFLENSIQIGLDSGISMEQFIIDPGIGFGKLPEHNLVVMARLNELKAIGCPILVGTSKKRFIGEVLGLPADERVEGTGATVTAAIMKGANIVRVHDVKTMARVAKMTDAIMRSGFNV